MGLAKYTGRGFMFSAKINQRFTPAIRLDEDATGTQEDFVQLLDPLGIGNTKQTKTLKRLQRHVERELTGRPSAGTLDSYARINN